MNFRRNKTLIVAITVIVALSVAFPAIQQLAVTPQTEKLTEFWLLGPKHDTVYPSNVTSGENYRLYLDVSNHLGRSASYTVEIKFRNQTQSAPNSFNHTNSLLSAIGTLKLSAADNQTTELPIDVSFHYRVNDRNPRLLEVQDVTVNGEALSTNATTITYDTLRGGFYGNLFFELWLPDENTGALQYHERYVSLWVKMNT